MEIGSLADRSPDGVSQNKIIQERKILKWLT